MRDWSGGIYQNWQHMSGVHRKADSVRCYQVSCVGSVDSLVALGAAVKALKGLYAQQGADVIVAICAIVCDVQVWPQVLVDPRWHSADHL